MRNVCSRPEKLWEHFTMCLVWMPFRFVSHGIAQSDKCCELPRSSEGFCNGLCQVASGSFNGVYLSNFCFSFFNHFSKLLKLPTDLSPYWSGGCLRYAYIHSIPFRSVPFHSIPLHYIHTYIHTLMHIHTCKRTYTDTHTRTHMHACMHACMHAIFTLAGMFLCALQCFVDAVFECIWEGRVFRALMASKSLGTGSVPHWTLGLCMPRVLQSLCFGAF